MNNQPWMQKELEPKGIKQFSPEPKTAVPIEPELIQRVLANENRRELAYKTGAIRPTPRTQRRWKSERAKLSLRIAASSVPEND